MSDELNRCLVARLQTAEAHVREVVSKFNVRYSEEMIEVYLELPDDRTKVWTLPKREVILLECFELELTDAELKAALDKNRRYDLRAAGVPDLRGPQPASAAV